MSTISFPRVKVSGSAYERGLQYGQQARSRILRNIEIYRQVFEYYAGWSWHTVIEHAAAFERPIETFRAHFVDEMRGIAAGSGAPFSHILAINVRTEIMFAAVARAAAEGCTAVVALPEATFNRHTLLAQNWDWKLDAAETVVILEAETDEGPSFTTAVEAGLLAKTGMNSAGIGLVTNALVSDQDKGEPGVPYHAILRAILESETMAGAVTAITRFPRASSANYLIAHRDGEAINVEAAPGDYGRVYVTLPEESTFAHTNHFKCTDFDLKDVEIWSGPGSLFRERRAARLLAERRGALDATSLGQVLTDHFDRPYSVCSHIDPKLPHMEQYVSILSIIMDLSGGELWLADGNPCQAEYQQVIGPEAN